MDEEEATLEQNRSHTENQIRDLQLSLPSRDKIIVKVQRKMTELGRS